MRHRLLLAAALFTLACGNAVAGVVITSNHTILSGNQTNAVSAYFEADRLKIVTPQSTVIFRGDLNRTWVITPAASAYVEITPEIVSAFAARLAAAQAPGSADQAKLQERLAKLPPDQRAIAEQQL